MCVKKIVITLMLAGMSIPFILLTDLYPFFRFGMFAEPVKRDVQVEQFVISYLDHNKNAYVLDPAEVGLNSLTYLMRNYYYRGEADVLLQNIHKAYTNRKPVYEWQLMKIQTEFTYPFETDTTIVEQFRPAL